MKALRLKQRLTVALAAACLTVAVYLLNAEFRPSGVLGLLQVAAVPLNFVPYLVGAMFGGSAHAPNATVFYLTLFFQFYLLLSLVAWVSGPARASARPDS